MKSDLDRLMAEQNIDALLILGPAAHNPAMYYMTGDAHLTQGDLLKKRGEPPVLFHWPMERDEAARTGLRTKNINDYDPVGLLKAANGERVRAEAARYTKMLEEYGVTGTVALYGKVEVAEAFAVFTELGRSLPGVNFIGQDGAKSVVVQARATKDEAEVERIRRMGEITVSVVGETAEFLTSHRVKGSTLVKKDGTPLTVGEVKRKIDVWLMERGAANPEGTIFAIGRDAGVPHSNGTASDPIELGKTIVYDIFPQEPGGGYFYDFTRTWCLGHAPVEVQGVYQEVLDAFNAVSAAFKVNALCRDYQKLICERFESHGHPTVMSNPKTQDGYVHSLGHGVGLAIHEQPAFRMLETATDRLVPGSVITVEPGLYYPDKGFGVRLEDTVWVRPDGAFETLASFPKDLVLKPKAGARRKKLPGVKRKSVNGKRKPAPRGKKAVRR